MLNGSNASRSLDPEGLEHAICVSPTHLLEDGFVFAYGLRPQGVIGQTFNRVCVDFCTKGTNIMIQNEAKMSECNTRKQTYDVL
jgi:hypothetical protein